MNETKPTIVQNQLQPQVIPPELIPEDQCAIYRQVFLRAREVNLHFAVGGAFALAFYTGLWRNTKDLDLYVLPEDRERMIQVLTDCGLSDYYNQAAYDRAWIYRSVRDGNIVDVIWAMANKLTMVDPVWLDHGSEGGLCGERLPLLAPEEMLWANLYIIQRDRSGWPDIFNLLSSAGPSLDWAHILERVATDSPLLASLLSAFAWLTPDRAAEIPGWLWDHLHLERPQRVYTTEVSRAADRRRAALLDSRPWFGPAPEGE
jgi:hypothetical protein